VLAPAGTYNENTHDHSCKATAEFAVMLCRTANAIIAEKLLKPNHEPPLVSRTIFCYRG